MNEERIGTIEQVEVFLGASARIEFSGTGNDSERYGHISRVLKRFDYPRRGKRERGVLLRYLQHTSGYSRAQVTRLVTRWQRNRLAEIPLVKRYGGPTVPFPRKYDRRKSRGTPRPISGCWSRWTKPMKMSADPL